MNTDELREQFKAGNITWLELQNALEVFGAEITEQSDIDIYYLIPLNETSDQNRIINS